MKGLKNILLEEQNRLEAIIKFQKSQLKNVPEGTLRLSKSHGKTQYYQSSDKNKKGIYLGKGKEELICNLAQKTYDEKIFNITDGTVKLISDNNGSDYNVVSIEECKNYQIKKIKKIFL